MNAVSIVAASAAVVVASSSALAQFEQVNSVAVGLRYFPDIPSSTVSVTQNSFPGVLQFQESFPARPTGASGSARHVGILSQNGTTPYVIPANVPWFFQATVRMDGEAANEVGLHIGSLGPVAPWNFGANTGSFMVNGATREIAAFGGWLPFFSTFQPQWLHLGLGNRAQEFTLGVRVRPISPTSVTAEYFVNGVGTGPLALDAGAVAAFYGSGQSAGVYAQNAWIPGSASTATSTFTNFVVPAPGAGAWVLLLSCGAARRRRR